MKALAALLVIVATVIPFIPLLVLVIRADRTRLMIETLNRLNDHGCISQDEFEQRRHALLNRRGWNL